MHLRGCGRYPASPRPSRTLQQLKRSEPKGSELVLRWSLDHVRRQQVGTSSAMKTRASRNLDPSAKLLPS